jgi:hypothetical protein
MRGFLILTSISAAGNEGLREDELSGDILGQCCEAFLLMTLFDEDGSFALLNGLRSWAAD